MTELDRIYEDIERLLETGTKSDNATSFLKMDAAAESANKNGLTLLGASNSKYICKDSNGNLYFYDTSKHGQENPWVPYDMNKLNKGALKITQPYNPPKEEKGLSVLPKQNTLPAQDSQFKSGVPAVGSNNSTSLIPSNISNSTDIQTLSSELMSYFDRQDTTIWETGEWKNFCDVNEENYYVPRNSQNLVRFSLNTENKVTPKEMHILSENEEQQPTWYNVGEYEPQKGWIQSWPPEPVNSEASNGDKQIIPVTQKEKEKLPDAAAEVLNTDTQLNYRLKAVIDSPDIQKQIDASPNGINFVGLNGDKISLITMAESQVIKEFNIPDFINKFLEAKEFEISSLGSGGQTNLNVFLTPEIQNYLKTKKGNPNITKVMLGKDGLVWLMDDKNNPILLDDMGVNNEIPAKDQQGNSFSVFINNGGAGGGVNGGAVGGITGNVAGTTSNESEPYGEVTQLITRSELVSIKPQIQKKLNNIVDEVDLSSINEAIQKDGYQIEITKLQLSQAVKGTFLEDSKDWKQIKEASETEEKKKDKSEKTETVQTTTGDTEVYVIEEYVLKPIGNQEEVHEVSESAESHFLNVLREAQKLLREDVEPEEVSEDTVEEQDNDTQNEEERLARKNQAIEIVPKVTSYSVASLLNEGGKVSLRIKTKDETTFTGNKKESMSFSFSQGDSNKCGHKVIDEENGIYKGWFTITIIKGNPKETGATKFNRFMNGLTGVANWVNKVQGSGTASQKQ